ncbi:glycosyltransferase family 4 protein [Fictibacillus phosphorivorans]|uniref:glycosyltransferase family 4 protein n=1 Tax=Fictibacillus phosphorivorans TaxID=1221500 RepID=UPI0035ED9969
MKILVLTEDYPSNSNKYAMSYVHSRNLEYIKNRIEVTVLCFRSKNSYEIDNIRVFPESKVNINNFDMVISHAPNLKNHVRYILKYRKCIKKILFFIHGHEVLLTSKIYPEPYKLLDTSSNFKKSFINIYDHIKIKVIKFFLLYLLKNEKCRIVFVSEWMFEEFVKHVKVSKEKLGNNYSIIPNALNSVFLEESYKPIEENNLILTIRPFDNSKYCVDLVNEIAHKNPNFEFHLYGKGNYFKKYKKADNLYVYNKFFTHNEMPGLFNKYKAVLMPTRLDAQGVMMCEMATFGVPLITSDIKICKDMLSNFENVTFINNEVTPNNLSEILNNIIKNETSNKYTFSKENTVLREVNLIKSQW